MQTNDERLDFIVQFAQLDLKRQRPAEWVRLRQGLQAFVGTSPGTGHPKYNRRGWTIVGTQKPEWQEPLTDKDWEMLQNDIISLLQEIVQEEKLPDGRGMNMTKPQAVTVECQLWCPPGVRFLFFGGATRDVVLMILHFLLLTQGFAKVRACPAPKPRQQKPCGRLFVRRRKQQYCSRQCKERVRKQRV